MVTMSKVVKGLGPGTQHAGSSITAKPALTLTGKCSLAKISVASCADMAALHVSGTHAPTDGGNNLFEWNNYYVCLRVPYVFTCALRRLQEGFR